LGDQRKDPLFPFDRQLGIEPLLPGAPPGMLKMGFGHEIEPLECWSLSHDAILPTGRDGCQDPGERIHRNLVAYFSTEG
jgi:hypothetical protein